MKLALLILTICLIVLAFNAHVVLRCEAKHGILVNFTCLDPKAVL